MEWANGDLRYNIPRTHPPPFSKVQETVVDFHGYTPPSSRDYPGQTRLEYGSDLTRPECTPNHCGYPPTANLQYGITHPNYQITPKSTHSSSTVYSSDRPNYIPSSRDFPSSYPHHQCTYGSSSHTSSYLPESERSPPCVGAPCSECPGSTTCDYAPIQITTSCGYPPTDECHGRTDLGPLPDVHPEVRHKEVIGSGDMRHPPPPTEMHREVVRPPEVVREELRPECYDSRSIRSHHASHCDLREFEEWRDMRGSRESVGTLPPELETHLKQCRCNCDHLGYGNYQSLVDGRVAHISRSHSSCSIDTCRHDPPTVYTQLSYLDSPRSNSSNGFTRRRKVGGELSAKHWMLVGLVFLVAVTAGVSVGVPLALRGDPSQSLDMRITLAKKILSEYPLIDGHNDLPWNIRSFIHNQLEKLKLNESLKLIEPWSISNWSHTDIPRLQEGHVGGQFWVAYTPCDSQYLNSVQLTLEQIDLIKRVLRKYNKYLELVTNSKDIRKVFKKGKIASLIAIEGGHGISNSLGTLRMMYDLGVRYLTLTHACNTPWATSSVVENKESSTLTHTGLTAFGKKVVQEMNRLGMMVDLSHVSTQTMRDALATTRAPVIFSHSSARALCDNPRNVPDDVLREVKKNGGIVMVSFFADHISCSHRANVTHVAKHINHIRQVAGIHHVGIGADFDGINRTPEGLEDVSKYPMLLAELLKDPQWSVEDIRKLVGENIIRVFSEVERVRDDLLAKGVEPEEEEIHPEYLRGKTNCTYFFD